MAISYSYDKICIDFPTMKTLHILVVTRNRLAGLIEALASIVRLVAISGCEVNVNVTIQDNSDDFIPSPILKYFSSKIPIQYRKTANILPMSANWNEGLMYVVRQQPDFIAVLADRRLISANLLNAITHLEECKQPFVCFDHQDVWINAHRVTRRSHTYNLLTFTRGSLLAAIGSAQVDWHYPMLFNCLIRTDFMQELAGRYGSFAEGSSPDMNFLARIADIGIENYCTYDAPCIITNARHVSKSNGNSALKTGTIYDIEHTRLSGIEAYPGYMENFLTANITGSLARYWSGDQMRELLDPVRFFMSSVLELSYPKSADAFRVMKASLMQYCNNYSLDPSMIMVLEKIHHSPSSSQVYPIDSSPDLSNSPAYDLLAQIERLGVLRSD